MTRIFAVALLTLASLGASAQPQVATLGKCLGDNTSGKERKDLARWMFLAMAAHPEIKRYANDTVDGAAQDNARVVGALVTRLLTESCAAEVKEVVKASGSSSIQYAFETLGQLAMQELITDRSVRDSIALFERHMDQRKIADLLGSK